MASPDFLDGGLVIKYIKSHYHACLCVSRELFKFCCITLMSRYLKLIKLSIYKNSLSST
jgi:hypothetical protein